jgi:dihydrofolate reductase
MTVSIIVAVSTNNVIGRAGGLPWHLREDLQRFKKLTMGKPMIMGRGTWDSIGRPLPGRRSIVLTRQKNFAAAGCEVAHSPQQALEIVADAEEIMIIGGGAIYAQMLAMTNRIYLTRVHDNVDGDTFFPALARHEWRKVAVEDFPAGEGRPLGFTFEDLERIKNSN